MSSETGQGWVNFCAWSANTAAIVGEQASIIGGNVERYAAWLGFNNGMEAEVLATINAIVVAMMIVIFSQPERKRSGLIHLERSKRRTADPADISRIAYNGAVLIAGWFCLISTLIMTVDRAEEPTALLIVASNVTMFGCFLGTAHFWWRMAYLRIFGAGRDDHPGEGLALPPA